MFKYFSAHQHLTFLVQFQNQYILCNIFNWERTVKATWAYFGHLTY